MVVGVDYFLQVVDICAVLVLADLSSRQRLRIPRRTQSRAQPVGGKDFASIGQFRKQQALGKRAVEMSDHAQLQMDRQVEDSAKGVLLLPIQSAWPCEAQRIVIVGCQIG